MSFTSLEYLLFFSVVALLYYVTPPKIRWVWLLLSGIFFYAHSGLAFLFVPVFIFLITWYAGLQIEREIDSKRAWRFYIGAISLNIGLLVFFKYTDFFTNTFVDLLNIGRHRIFHREGDLGNPLLLHLIAPLGISYITFQAIGYLIEIKRGNHPAEKSPGYFATYLLFFPKITAGPVERAHHFLPQLRTPIVFEYDNMREGLRQVLWGMFKKLVIADRLALYVSSILDNAGFHSGSSLLLACIFYVFQMYADFSGYTDMALGFARILGFRLSPNFNRPFFSKSVPEFWRKWHISLSSWFGDYFYTPIAAAKRDWGKWGVVFAFFATFILLGFWHGASWTFIVFGALQGLVLTLDFFTRKFRKKIRKKIPEGINNVFSIMFVFAYFGFSLIFFRAGSLGEAGLIIKRIFTVGGPLYFDRDEPSSFIFSIAGILMLLFAEAKAEYYTGSFSFFNNRFWLVRNLTYALLVVIILMIGVFDGGQFIYKQF